MLKNARLPQPISWLIILHTTREKKLNNN